jgi:phospholipid/cholesterol/gamma-HCH transport system substrate-binding protein
LTIARGVAIAALALAIVLVALLLVRGANTHEYDLLFQNAGQLVKGDDVQVGGRRIGSVREITLTDDNRARVRIRVEEPFAPLRDGTHAVIRLTSLSGIANRFIALTPAPNSAKELDDGATLAAGSTTGVVDLDQLFNTLDPKARKDLQGVIKGFATQYDGRGEEAGETAEYFNPFLSTSRQLVNQLTQDEGTLTDFIVNSSRAVTAIAEKRDDVASLVGNTNTTAAAIASQDAALEQALGLLPTTLRRANTTFVNLRATLDDLDPLVDASKPATKELAPFLRELRPLVQSAIPTIHDLRRLVTTPGANNDLIDATRKMPALQRVASPTFKNSTQALVKSQPVLEYIRPYTPELTGWFHDFGQGTANYDANGHFARIQPIFNAFQFTNTPAGGTLVPNTMNGRFNDLEKYQNARCPGSASQPTADGSAPNTDDGNLGANDCDPSQVPPGP